MRRARPEDRDAVLAFATRTWDGRDYIPAAWPYWLAARDGVVLVATPRAVSSGDQPEVDAAGEVLEPDVPIAVTRLSLLSREEAWLEGIRVDPRVRGRSVATTVQVAELAWAAAHGATVIRYVTDADNLASHRLGAHHGFRVVGAWRRYGPRDDEAAQDEAAQDETKPAEDAGANVISHLAQGHANVVRSLRSEGLTLPSDAPEATVRGWWERVAGDPTFAAGRSLYERRAWSFQTLTEAAFTAHVRAGEVLAVEGSPGAGAPEDGHASTHWGVLIVASRWLEEDELYLAAATGDARCVTELAERAASATEQRTRLRLPDPDPPLVAGATALFQEAGLPPGDHLLHLLERPIDPREALPEPDATGLLSYAEPPRAVALPPTP